MLLQFRVENHRSLHEEQTLTLTASTQAERSDVHLLTARGLDEPVLPSVALYGANASGKTNVLHALAFMRRAVLESHRLWDPGGGTPQQPFALVSGDPEPSRFEVDVWVDSVRYRYGFLLGSTRVAEEWLYAWPQGRKQTWLERTADTFEFGRHFHGENEAIRGLTRPNSLYLSAAAQNNHPATLPLFSWFMRLATIVRWGRDDLFPSSRASIAFSDLFQSAEIRQAPDDEETAQKRAALVRLLQAADTGIVDIQFEARGGQPRDRLLFKHRSAAGHDAWLPLGDQSAGTLTLLQMGLKLIDCLRHGGVLCVDELEASLHPMLALEVLRAFHSGAENPGRGQLLFTTHDTNLIGNLLGQSPLRRDQIWFTEKDRDGATHLYPLTDFHPRKEENLERGYLQGRYGAVPFLGKLVPETNG